MAYFKAVLEKDSTWFDEHNPTEMASKIAKETVTIQRGSGEKVGQVVMSWSGFILGFVFAFIIGWLYTCILFGMAPLIGFTGILMTLSMESGMIEQMKSYGQSAGYAEQALSAIKVVHTYGQECLELKNYTKYLERAQITAHKQCTKQALGIGGLFGSFFLLYAYAFIFGGMLRWNEVESSPG
jgi:ABC-type multidrug transport system fused ATPase/permease subunit